MKVVFTVCVCKSLCTSLNLLVYKLLYTKGWHVVGHFSYNEAGWRMSWMLTSCQNGMGQERTLLGADISSTVPILLLHRRNYTNASQIIHSSYFVKKVNNFNSAIKLNYSAHGGTEQEQQHNSKTANGSVWSEASVLSQATPWDPVVSQGAAWRRADSALTWAYCNAAQDLIS